MAALVALAGGCADRAPEREAGVMVVSQEGGQRASWVRNFNPLSPAASPRWPTTAGVYEPLMVFNSVRGEQVPWLAVDARWEGQRRLVVTLRDSVRWSDGERFDADDVVFTFRLLRRFPALDGRGIWSFLADVRREDDLHVTFDFSRIFVPGFDEIVNQVIVPEHVWSHVDDPVGFANENPVGTGPYTEVRVFRAQVYELGRNPYYWQPGRPYVKALRFPAYPSNDRANLALVFDEVDWAGNFIPAIDRVYVRRDPEHHRYWFPLTGSMVFLYANTARAPFDDVRVRRALSMAIDRQTLVDVAAFHYSRPADATAMSDAYAAWRSDSVAAAATWTRYDPDSARALLDAAGCTEGLLGTRHTPDGKPMHYEVLVVAGWSDWVRASQVIARGLREVGIDATVHPYDFGAWFDRVQKGEFDLTVGWSFEGPTPYVFYRCLMGSATRKPVGELSPANWHRYASAAADSVLARFERERDPSEQRRLAVELQAIFAREAPAIPLYPNPSWAEYNTRRFTGFPTPEHPYADPSPNKFGRGECLMVLTNIRPREVTP